MNIRISRRWIQSLICCCGLAALISSTGCQSYLAGQTLPSPYYRYDDVQYHAPGTEFKLSNEAAVLRTNREQQIQQGQGQ